MLGSVLLRTAGGGREIAAKDSLSVTPGCEYIPGQGLPQSAEDLNLNSSAGQTLFQDSFFFCDLKNIGDIPGTGCIFVETVVDRDSEIAFAKVYPARSAMNAVDTLASRVMPFFAHCGKSVKAIYTKRTSEYCGLPLAHPYETFLITSRVQHLDMIRSTEQHGDPCRKFYSVLLNQFFPPLLRRKFILSLSELQNELTEFLEGYNAERATRFGKTEFPSPMP